MSKYRALNYSEISNVYVCERVLVKFFLFYFLEIQIKNVYIIATKFQDYFSVCSVVCVWNFSII
jgi:hypothetical protein